ncbi:hypothetical protein FKP32DRAFT_1576004 [Trametes sanguinea]|nr:hypothetical protein FKP32DRAFT_1576004 [Trametes sanguinea]
MTGANLSVAYQTLLCPDVSANIFEYLAPGHRPSPEELPFVHWEWQNRRHALFVLAQTCSALAGPALDVLWRIVEEPSNLLAILPTYAVGSRCFCGVITDEHWERFQLYASRVLELEVVDTQRYSQLPCDSTWTMLMQRSSGGPALSQLSRLAIDDDQASALMALLHQGITYLDVKASDTSSRTFDLISLFADIIRPHLSHIARMTLVPYMVSALEPAEGGRFGGGYELSALTHIEELHLSRFDNHRPITLSFVTAIVSFPRLRELEINLICSADSRASLATNEVPAGFFELRVLKLTGTPPDIAAFLEATDPPCLEELILIVPESRTEPTGRGFVTEGALQRLYEHIPLSIRRFRFRMCSFVYPRKAHPSLDLDALHQHFAPLRNLEELRRVSLSVENSTACLTERHLLDLCTAWPHLTHFEFLPVRLTPAKTCYPTFPTFSTTLAFVRAHPFLVHLVLPGLSPVGIPDVGTPAASTFPLRQLWIDRLAPNTPIVPLAIALDAVFPNLDLGPVAISKVKPSDYIDEDEEYYPRRHSANTADYAGTLRTVLSALQTSRRLQLSGASL